MSDKVDDSTVAYIYDTVGSLVNQSNIDKESSIDISTLGAGIYFIRVEHLGNSKTVKFVKL